MPKITSTVSKIIRLRQLNPGFTLQQIGIKIGVTKQMVHKTLKFYDYPTKGVKERKSRTKAKYYIRLSFCKICRKLVIKRRKYCSECKKEQFYGYYECFSCGRNFLTRHRLIDVKMDIFNFSHHFCSIPCYDAYRRDKRNELFR